MGVCRATFAQLMCKACICEILVLIQFVVLFVSYRDVCCCPEKQILDLKGLNTLNFTFSALKLK